MLQHQYIIYVPSTYQINKVLNENLRIETINSVIERLLTIATGVTVTECVGYWNSPTKGLVNEAITKVSVFCDSEKTDVIIDICKDLNIKLMQDCVAYEYNGTLNFI